MIKTPFIYRVFAIVWSSAAFAQTSDTPVKPDDVHIRVADHRAGGPKKHFVRFGQCQFRMRLDAAKEPERLHRVEDSVAERNRIRDCLTIAEAEHVDVLVLPELAMAMPDADRESELQELRRVAQKTGSVIIAGSYYDNSRHSRLVIVGPDWLELGYKVRPSRYEASPKDGEGMRGSDEVLLLRVPQGNLAVITCVDLISDEVQHALRQLAIRGEVDTVVNINYNRPGLEFLVEANSFARRHPVFVSITNVACPTDQCPEGQPEEAGSCYGNSAVFASLRTRADDAPDSVVEILNMLPKYLLRTVGGNSGDNSDKLERLVPYDTVVGALGSLNEAMLIYELNMYMVRESLATNTPDQGYPPLRGLKIVPLPPRK